MYHHTAGVFLTQEIFGRTIKRGRIEIPVREVAELHIIEDLGWLPSPKDYIENMELRPWMGGEKEKRIIALKDFTGGMAA